MVALNLGTGLTSEIESGLYGDIGTVEEGDEVDSAGCLSMDIISTSLVEVIP